MKAIREQIASAVDIIVQQSRLKDGSRRITHITEVQGMEGEVVILQDIFRYDQKAGEKGKKFTFTGIKPRFLDKLEDNGVKIPSHIFIK